ncbi:HupE/UreJ family protein [Sorangium atrum]|uniref:HupE/UreJ family protein n=1 Tax=Sorangium atrum TaxID=2995308 RepID=A0ABT5C9H2_9BACT|nr:HupE/UreJ family protein [Sorangium aterium]MDC0683022.1 HupE/UreJ family protein [Sorangium aterium]
MSVALVALLSADSALAHDPFEITTEASLLADRLEVQITMARGTAATSCPDAAGGRPREGPASLEAWRSRMEACAPRLYEVTAGGEALRPSAARAALTVENDAEMTLVYPLPARGPLRFDAVLLRQLPEPTFGAEIRVMREGALLGQQLLRAEASTFEIDIAAPAPGAGAPAPARPEMPSFGQYLRLGVEHILTGYDHLLFLTALLAVCRSVRSVLGIITCFTLAHSLTLVLAVLQVVTISSRVVEPLIAATIVFVGAENLLRGEEPKGRWALTFAFGLIHGLGFAGVLRELGLGEGGGSIVVPLLSFNLGVELGQLGITLLFLPILWRLRAAPAFARHGQRGLSLVVVALGLYWLVERAVS